MPDRWNSQASCRLRARWRADDDWSYGPDIPDPMPGIPLHDLETNEPHLAELDCLCWRTVRWAKRLIDSIVIDEPEGLKVIVHADVQCFDVIGESNSLMS